MSRRRVHGVIVTFKRPALLRESLDRVAGQSRRIDHLVVVNNDPLVTLDDTAVFDDDAEKVTVVEAGDNLGPAGGIALGMQTVLEGADDHDLVLVLDDDDPLVDEHVVRDLAARFDERAAVDSSLGAIGLRGAVLDHRTGRLGRADPSDGTAVEYLKSDWAPVYLVSAIRRAGTFRSDLFFGFDDFEMGARLRSFGFAVEAHRMGREEAPPQTSASAGFRRAPWRTYYTQRNLLVILWGFGHRLAALRIALLGCVLKPLVNLVLLRPGSTQQAMLSVRALVDAVRRNLGRTIEPTVAKFSGETAPAS